MKIVICEDNDIDRAILYKMVESYFNSRHIDCVINKYSYGSVLLADFKADAINPSIIFMDIVMPRMNGIDVARELRKLNYWGQILFLTATDKFAIDGYEVDARGYFLKPYESEKIYAALDRIVSNAGMNSYLLKSHGNLIRLPLPNIIYVESQGNKCIFHCADHILYYEYKKLNDIESEINGHHFIRCHQSYYVNMDYISKVDAQFTLSNGDTIPIRKRELGKIKKTYKIYSRRNGI